MNVLFQILLILAILYVVKFISNIRILNKKKSKQTINNNLDIIDGEYDEIK